MTQRRIGVVGAGGWGTALANAAARAGADVVLWGRDPSQMASIATERVNAARLPGVRLEDAVRPTADPQLLSDREMALLVVPAQTVRQVCQQLAGVLPSAAPLVVCAKGIERGSGLFMTQVIADVLPKAVTAILSGPSFADDVAAGLPTAVTVAAAHEVVAADIARALNSPTFRLYHSGDVRGVEIGGAAKNVLAIAAGIVAGRKLGASAAAALTARGFAELLRFGRYFGARTETLTGLSGLGDLILTCGGPQSRNFAFGLALGAGKPDGGKLAEGAMTAPVLVEMARQAGIELPIAEAVAGVLAGRLAVGTAIEALMTRPMRGE